MGAHENFFSVCLTLTIHFCHTRIVNFTSSDSLAFANSTRVLPETVLFLLAPFCCSFYKATHAPPCRVERCATPTEAVVEGEGVAMERKGGGREGARILSPSSPSLRLLRFSAIRRRRWPRPRLAECDGGSTGERAVRMGGEEEY